MRSDEDRLYRLAMVLTLLAAAMSILMTILNYYYDFLSGRAAGAMAFGMVFWFIIFWGYRSDYLQRKQEQDEARKIQQSSKTG